MSAPVRSPRSKARPDAFPGWRLKNDVMNATDADLEKAGESCERWGAFGAGLVVLGVIAEVVIAARHPLYDSILEQWGSALADSLVAIGVAIEVQFGRMGSRRQSELHRRSNERTAKAELETERLRAQLAWRRLSPQQIEKISEVLAKHDGTKYCLRVVHPANDPECMTFAGDIAAAFRAAGWRVQSVATVSSTTFSGVIIPRYAPPDLDACSIVLFAMSNAGIKFAVGAPPRLEGLITASGDEVTSPTAEIHVGTKPEPNLG